MSALLDKAIAAGLLIGIAFTALAFGAVEPWPVAVFEWIIATVILLWSIKIAAEGRLKFSLPAPALPLAALLALGLLQAVVITDGSGHRQSLSMDVEATRAVLPILLFLLASLIIAANFYASAKQLQVLARFFIIFGLAIAVFALVQHFTWEGRFYWLRETRLQSTFGPFGNRNHFAGYMNLLIPFPIALLISRSARQWWIIYGFAAVAMGTATVVSGSRGGMICLFAELVFITLMSRRVSGHKSSGEEGQRTAQGLAFFWKSAGAVAVISIAILVGVLWVGAETVLERISQSIDDVRGTNSGPQMTRQAIWKGASSMIRANPFLGAGLGAFATVYPIYGQTDGSLVVAHAHNDYLQILADGGIVGGAIALWFIVASFRGAARGMLAHDPLLSGFALASGAALTGMLVHSLFDFNLQIPSNALLFLVISGVAYQIGARRSTRQETA